jgi:FkbM family methyltransferase
VSTARGHVARSVKLQTQNDTTDSSIRGCTLGIMSANIFMRKVVCAILPRQVTLSRRLRDGTLVSGPNRAGYGGRGAFIFGDEIEPELAALDKLLRRGDVLIDVGANSGVYTLKGARIVGSDGVVLSLEPNPDLLAILKRNTGRNCLDNVRLRGLAAAEECREFPFFEIDNKPNSFSLVSPGDGTATFSVLAVDLDSLVHWEGIDRVDVIKIDAEGVENRVLAGASEIIREHQPVIIAEVHKKDLSALPDGYRSFQLSGSPNKLLIPQGHRLIADAAASGWADVGDALTVKPV